MEFTAFSINRVKEIIGEMETKLRTNEQAFVEQATKSYHVRMFSKENWTPRGALLASSPTWQGCMTLRRSNGFDLLSCSLRFLLGLRHFHAMSRPCTRKQAKISSGKSQLT